MAIEGSSFFRNFKGGKLQARRVSSLAADLLPYEEAQPYIGLT
jgi:hypothetical protein